MRRVLARKRRTVWFEGHGRLPHESAYHGEGHAAGAPPDACPRKFDRPRYRPLSPESGACDPRGSSAEHPDATRIPHHTCSRQCQVIDFMSIAITAVVKFSLLAFVFGCSKPGDTRVTVQVLDGPGAVTVEELRVHLGGENFTRTLGPGESLSVVLNPVGGLPCVTLLFLRNGESHGWRGACIEGGKRYEISIGIDPGGSIMEKHCKEPCSLPEW